MADRPGTPEAPGNLLSSKHVVFRPSDPRAAVTHHKRRLTDRISVPMKQSRWDGEILENTFTLISVDTNLLYLQVNKQEHKQIAEH